jgi:hypothetical protein
MAISDGAESTTTVLIIGVCCEQSSTRQGTNSRRVREFHHFATVVRLIHNSSLVRGDIDIQQP